MSLDDCHPEFVRADSEPAFEPEAIRRWPKTVTEGLHELGYALERVPSGYADRSSMTRLLRTNFDSHKVVHGTRSDDKTSDGGEVLTWLARSS